jgi:hypothetical protein
MKKPRELPSVRGHHARASDGAEQILRRLGEGRKRNRVGIAHVYWLPWLQRHYHLAINLPPSAAVSENTQNNDFAGPASRFLSLV